MRRTDAHAFIENNIDGVDEWPLWDYLNRQARSGREAQPVINNSAINLSQLTGRLL